MPLKVWIKSHLADKALAPLRSELVAMLDPGSTLLDIGCGTGDLLFRCAEKVRSALGVDLDEGMITFAKEKSQLNAITHLSFQCANACHLERTQFDVATSTLCLHEMTEPEACEVLTFMATVSKRVLIADYAKPNTLMSKIGIEFDELISGHYGRFRSYRRAGYVPAYANRCGLEIMSAVPSSIDGIVIWEIQGKFNR